MIIEDNTVEACAHLVIYTYPEIEAILKKNPGGDKVAEHYLPIKFPFGRQLRPDLFYLANSNFEMAQTIKARLEAKGFKVYKSEIRKRLEANNGVLSPEDIEDMIGVDEFRGIEIEEIIGPSKPQTLCLLYSDT